MLAFTACTLFICSLLWYWQQIRTKKSFQKEFRWSQQFLFRNSQIGNFPQKMSTGSRNTLLIPCLSILINAVICFIVSITFAFQNKAIWYPVWGSKERNFQKKNSYIYSFFQTMNIKSILTRYFRHYYNVHQFEA